MMAIVALAAVVLTTWMTVGAVFEAQQDLFRQVDGLETGAPAATSEDEGQAPERSWPPWRPGGANSERFERGPAAEAFGRITRTALGAGLLSFILAVIAAGIFTDFLTRPLRALTRGARRLEAGERGIRLPLPAGRDELRGLTEAFNGLVTGLERQEAWRRNLTADIAHDLRTPLAVLRGEIEGMQDGVVAVDAGGLARLHSEVMLLARLVDDLKVLSESEGGVLSLRLEETALEPLLRRSVESFGSRAAESGVELVMQVDEPELTALVDPDRILQVIGNLLDNALRYAGPGLVEVGAASTAIDVPASAAADDVEQRPGVRLWVRDHGPGLPADAGERVFERFYRGDKARTRAAHDRAAGTHAPRDRAPGTRLAGAAPGSGLGLAIAKALVEAHGGSISAHDHPDGGALFVIELPVAGRPA